MNTSAIYKTRIDTLTNSTELSSMVSSASASSSSSKRSSPFSSSSSSSSSSLSGSLIGDGLLAGACRLELPPWSLPARTPVPRFGGFSSGREIPACARNLRGTVPVPA